MLVFYDTKPLVEENRFVKCAWTEFYPRSTEVEPPNASVELQGKPINLSCYVDADYAGCCMMQCSHSGILIFLNRAPIVHYSKRQNTVESSTFGTE
jgi:hypothetical protein